MLCRFPAKAFSILSVITLASGLGACELPPTYMVEQLDAVPVPAPMLMRSASGPDCGAQPSLPVAARASKSKGKDEGVDFENESAEAGKAQASAEKKTAAGPGIAELKEIEKERDCYRQAERVTRKHLNRLQVETTRTVSALDEVRQDMNLYRVRP